MERKSEHYVPLPVLSDETLDKFRNEWQKAVLLAEVARLRIERSKKLLADSRYLMQPTEAQRKSFAKSA